VSLGLRVKVLSPLLEVGGLIVLFSFEREVCVLGRTAGFLVYDRVHITVLRPPTLFLQFCHSYTTAKFISKVDPKSQVLSNRHGFQ
jgi:hypothetical protein